MPRHLMSDVAFLSHIPECIALAQGLHPRLGRASPLFRLEPCLVRLIADLYCEYKIETHHVEREALVPLFPVDERMCVYTNPLSGEAQCRFMITANGFSVEGIMPQSPHPYDAERLGFVYFFGPSMGERGRLCVTLTSVGHEADREISIQTGCWYRSADLPNEVNTSSLIVENGSQTFQARYTGSVKQSMGAYSMHVLVQPFNGSVELFWG